MSTHQIQVPASPQVIQGWQEMLRGQAHEYFPDGLTADEIAAACGLAGSTVRHRLTREVRAGNVKRGFAVRQRKDGRKRRVTVYLRTTPPSNP